ncbi:MAG TPA: phosphatidylserine decarboxylase family protein [Candidatus Acidoferrales bacterium]|nr:phosphatidylserine decarboxylase family protein [Candidatus Acidoferrales bacterium]
MRIAKEGYPLIIAAASVGLVAFFLGWQPIAVLAAAIALVLGGFFRDPERRPPRGEGLVVAPADGRIVALRNAGEMGTQVSIFLSPLDVHVNRSPIDGAVEQARYERGKFHAAFRDKASQYNERNTIDLVSPRGKRLRVVQIAGVLARRIVCYVKPGDSLQAGQRFGLIMFGSRVDLFIPVGAEIRVSEGQRVRAGETIVGRLP